MNKLLQWSTANTSAPTASSQPVQKPPLSKNDAAWLNNAFPDPYEAPKALLAHLSNTPPPTPSDATEILAELEDLFADLNHAINLKSLNALPPLISHATSPSFSVRAAALSALATALHNLPVAQTQFYEASGQTVLVSALLDQHASVRAKGVRLAGALLRNAPGETWALLTRLGVVTALAARVADEDASVRHRALFFLAHAPGTGCERFAWVVAEDRALVEAVVRAVGADDFDEAAVAAGALAVLVGVDETLVGRAGEALRAAESRVEKAGKDETEELREMLGELRKVIGA